MSRRHFAHDTVGNTSVAVICEILKLLFYLSGYFSRLTFIDVNDSTIIATLFSSTEKPISGCDKHNLQHLYSDIIIFFVKCTVTCVF